MLNYLPGKDIPDGIVGVMRSKSSKSIMARYVNREDVLDLLRQGWMEYPSICLSTVDFYGTVMFWICDCKIPERN